MPNVVLINAGTNDANQDGKTESVAGTGGRMKELINGIFAEVPEAVVVLSTLLPTDGNQKNVDDINNQYRALVKEFDNAKKEGDDPTYKVILAEMADGFITTGDLHDGTHPTPEGQRKMAAVWDYAIGKANDAGWIKKPSDSGKFTDTGGSTTCRKEYASGNDDIRGGRKILSAADPVIANDGKYKHDSKYRSEHKGAKTDEKFSQMQLYFAQLVNLENLPKGQERDEAIHVLNGEKEGDKDRKILFALNKGDGTFGAQKEIDVDDGCAVAGKHRPEAWTELGSEY